MQNFTLFSQASPLPLPAKSPTKYIEEQLIASVVSDNVDKLQLLLQSSAPQAGDEALRVSQLLKLALHNGSFKVATMLSNKSASMPQPQPITHLNPPTINQHVAQVQGAQLLPQINRQNSSSSSSSSSTTSSCRGNSHSTSVVTSISELEKEEYCTDYFRMYEFKVVACGRMDEHDHLECPFAHAAEKACRRDPKKFNYVGTACPDFRKGSCQRGDACGYAHGVFECWLHPSRYRTQLCQEGAACTRKVCFFAHHLHQLRAPEHQPFKGHSYTLPPNYNLPMSPNNVPMPQDQNFNNAQFQRLNSNMPVQDQNFNNAQIQRLNSLCQVLQQMNFQKTSLGGDVQNVAVPNDSAADVQSSSSNNAFSDDQMRRLTALCQVLQQLSMSSSISGVANNIMHGCNSLQDVYGNSTPNFGSLLQNIQNNSAALNENSINQARQF